MKSVKITEPHFAVPSGEVHPRWYEPGAIVTDPQVMASAIAQGKGRELTAEPAAPPANDSEPPQAAVRTPTRNRAIRAVPETRSE